VSDNQQLAHTGAGVLVIGTTVITGWWLLGAAAAIVLIGAVCIRFGFRRNRGADQS
jgi:hypothetical protein